jgi:hypothetical protein
MCSLIVVSYTAQANEEKQAIRACRAPGESMHSAESLGIPDDSVTRRSHHHQGAGRFGAGGTGPVVDDEWPLLTSFRTSHRGFSAVSRIMGRWDREESLRSAGRSSSVHFLACQRFEKRLIARRVASLEGELSRSHRSRGSLALAEESVSHRDRARIRILEFTRRLTLAIDDFRSVFLIPAFWTSAQTWFKKSSQNGHTVGSSRPVKSMV